MFKSEETRIAQFTRTVRNNLVFLLVLAAMICSVDKVLYLIIAKYHVPDSPASPVMYGTDISQEVGNGGQVGSPFAFDMYRCLDIAVLLNLG